MAKDEILAKMLKEAENNSYGRESAAHPIADDLLLDAIRLLASKCDEGEWAEKLIKAYDEVGKWYE